MELKKVERLIDVPRKGKIEKVQCYIRKLSVFAAMEWRKLVDAGDHELAVASTVLHSCVDEKYNQVFTVDEVHNGLTGDDVAYLFEQANQFNETEEKKP